MPEFYNTNHPYNRKVNLAFYSDKAWINYFLNFLLPKSPLEYLCYFENSYNNKPFLLFNKVINFVIFNKMDFGGKTGFGSADGGIYFETVKNNYFIFLLATNKTYRDDCNIPEKSKLDFHKSVNGRIEMLYRFTLALEKSARKNSSGSLIIEKPEEIHESYIKTDKFYIIPGKQAKKRARKVKFVETDRNNLIDNFFKKDTVFYFLIVTNDRINPLTTKHPAFFEHYTPRLYPAKEAEDSWEELKELFLWIPMELVTGQINAALSDFNYEKEQKFCNYYSGLSDFSPEKIAFETRDEVPEVSPTSYSRMDFISF